MHEMGCQNARLDFTDIYLDATGCIFLDGRCAEIKKRSNATRKEGCLLKVCCLLEMM